MPGCKDAAVERLSKLGSNPEQRNVEDTAIIVLSQLTPTQAWEVCEEVDARVGHDWLMALLQRRALETISDEAGDE